VVFTGGWTLTLFQGFSGKGLSFSPEEVHRSFLRGPVHRMVSLVYPFMKRLVEGLQRGILLRSIQECVRMVRIALSTRPFIVARS